MGLPPCVASARHRAVGHRHSTTSATGEPGRYRFDGRLTLHGVEQAVKFDAKVEKKDGGFVLRGQFPLAQTSYGIRPYSAALGLVRVRNELQIHGDVVLKAP